MLPTVYFLNRMSELQRMKRRRAGLWANTGYRAERRDPGRRTPGESWISHTAPWTFLWTHQGSDIELFHLIAPKCPGDVGNSDNVQVDICCICMHMCVWTHHKPVDRTPGIFIHPLETHATTTKSDPPLHPPPSPVRPAWCQGARWFCFQFK